LRVSTMRWPFLKLTEVKAHYRSPKKTNLLLKTIRLEKGEF
jgi:hypothetical protein